MARGTDASFKLFKVQLTDFTQPTFRALNSIYMQGYFKQFSILCSSEIIYSFLIQLSTPEALDIAFFIPLGIQKGRRMDYLFCA